MKSNVLSVFISERFEHVYKELNGEADTLRKEGLQLAEGSRLWSEIKDCHILHEHISASSNGDSYDSQYSEDDPSASKEEFWILEKLQDPSININAFFRLSKECIFSFWYFSKLKAFTECISLYSDEIKDYKNWGKIYQYQSICKPINAPKKNTDWKNMPAVSLWKQI